MERNLVMVQNQQIELLDDAVQLMQHWQQFCQQNQLGGTVSLADFAQWLLNQTTANEAVPASPRGNAQSPMPFAPPSASGQATVLIYRLYRYQRMLAKKAFEDAVPISLEEFFLLATVHQAAKPTKSEVISRNLLETTTGTEMLRRLRNLGYVVESVNPADRRARLLSLTSTGRALLDEAYPRLMNLAEWLVPPAILDQGGDDFIQTLHQLNRYHSGVPNHYR
jgi:DNA-binding MarR family transcriptional regulator